MLRQFSLLSFTVCVIAFALGGASLADPASPGGQLQVLRTMPAGGDGGWDYPTVDAAAHRLYVARGNRIMVLDCEKGSLLGEVTDLAGAHGVALVPERNLGFATSGRENVVTVFDLKTFKTLKKIKSGQNPDAILYDPASQRVFAFCGRSGDATIIDPAKLDDQPVSLPIGGKLETGVADGAGHVYVNDETKSEIVAIDSKQQKVLAHWPLAPGTAPTGLAMDVERRRLFAGCRNKTLAILDADSGKLLATVPTGAGVDGVVYDGQLGALSADGADGTITVVREGPAGQFSATQTLKTVKSARTIACDPTAHQAYLPARIPGENGTTPFGVVVVGLAGK